MLAAALQEQMDRLADTSLIGGERTDATDHCLAGIARLSNDVKDAASYTPTYDQRIYAEVCFRTSYFENNASDCLTGYKNSPREARRDPSYGRAAAEIQLQE